MGAEPLVSFTSLMATSYEYHVKDLLTNSPATETESTTGLTVTTNAERIRGEIEERRVKLKDAHGAVSVVRKFDNAAKSIHNNLLQMQQITENVIGGHYTTTEKAAEQKKLLALAAELNDIVENTEHENNKLLSSEGKLIRLQIDNGRQLQLFPKNLSFDANGLDLTTDAQNVLAKIETAINNTDERGKDLHNTFESLQETLEAFDAALLQSAGFDPETFRSFIAEDIAEIISGLIFENKNESEDAQANVSPETAFKLLTENT